MATTSGESIFARARTMASQSMSDANQSVVIDSKGGLRVLLNNVIRGVYRSKTSDQKFFRDIITRNTVAITSGIGACPENVMREFLHLGQFQDVDDSLIVYYDYNIDYSSGQNFTQLGYVCMQGDNLHYTAPYPTLDTYTDDLYVTCPTFPTFPTSMSDDITFPSTTVIDDIVQSLAEAIRGGESAAD